MKKARASSQTAADVFNSADLTVIGKYISTMLAEGGAVMVGQTRSQDTLIITTYVDGKQDKEYYQDAEALNEDLKAVEG